MKMLPMQSRRPGGPRAVSQRRLTAMLVLRVALPTVLSIVLFSVAVFAIILPAFERGLLTRKKEMLRELTKTVCATLARYEGRAQSGEFTRGEGQRRALEHVRALRYGADLKDYFWINDLQPQMVLHPYRTDLEGQDLTDYADPAGKHLFVEFVKVVERDGSGFVDYMWQWKDDPERIVPKLSYVQLFDSWGWIVGTGIYLEDVAAETGALTRQMVWATLIVLALAGVLSIVVIGQSFQFEADRRRALMALEASEEKYRVLVESMNDGLALQSEDGRLLFVNARFCEMLGRAQDEVLGRPITDFLTDRGREHLSPADGAAAARGVELL